MPMNADEIIALEHRFWQSMVDDDTDAALSLLHDPALMVSPHGSMQFDHAGYRKMAEQGTYTLASYDLRDMDAMFPNDATAILTYRVRQTMRRRDGSGDHTEEMADSSTWVREGDAWKCVMHTETPLAPAGSKH